MDQPDWERRVADPWAWFDERDEAVMAFLALADTGREREAVSLTLAALAPHLPQYQKTVANYARLLVEPRIGRPLPARHLAGPILRGREGEPRHRSG